MTDFLSDIKPGYYGCAQEVQPDDERHKLWQQQRLYRGFDDTELWNLNDTILRFILPRLDEFRKNLGGHPAELDEEEWYDILERLVVGIEASLADDNHLNPDEYSKETMELLFKWFNYLWD